MHTCSPGDALSEVVLELLLVRYPLVGAFLAAMLPDLYCDARETIHSAVGPGVPDSQTIMTSRATGTTLGICRWHQRSTSWPHSQDRCFEPPSQPLGTSTS